MGHCSSRDAADDEVDGAGYQKGFAGVGPVGGNGCRRVKTAQMNPEPHISCLPA